MAARSEVTRQPLSGLAGGPASASTTDAAFNNATGALNVDYASYLSKHDIVYNRPNTNTNPGHGLTVGNGRIGAMAWQNIGLTMQVSGVDTSQQTAFGAGLVNLATTPAMDSGYSTYQQRLSLYDGTLTTKYDNNRTVTVMGSPNSEVMGIHVDDTRGGVSSIALELSLWDVSQLGNSGDVPNLDTWKTVSTYADSAGAGLSRGQADPQNFGYTLARQSATLRWATGSGRMALLSQHALATRRPVSRRAAGNDPRTDSLSAESCSEVPVGPTSPKALRRDHHARSRSTVGV